MPNLVLFPKKPKAATQKTAASAIEQRAFIDLCLNNVQPIIFVDRYGVSHNVNIASANEVAYKTSKGKDETVLQLLMIEAQPETHEGSTLVSREQEQFLLDCLDTVTPEQFDTTSWGRRRVFMMQMEKRYQKTKKQVTEWTYTLTFVDADQAIYIYELPQIVMTITATVTAQTHVGSAYGYGAYGFSQYEG